MRKNIIQIMAAATFLCLATNAAAIPARKKPIQVTQPDGSIITVIKQGDEFSHKVTDMNGNLLVKDTDGFYRAASESPYTTTSKRSMVKAKRQATGKIRHNSRISLGSSRFLVVLVEFDDLRFSETDPTAGFRDLMNKKGYSSTRSTGSALDYYSENSSDRFNPTFDIVGPVTLSKGYKYYGENDIYDEDMDPDGAFFEACQMLDASVDFRQYDHDGDGYVDNIFFFYAGHNESEYDDEDTIWPHAWTFQANFESKKLDGVYLDSYACTSELSEIYDDNGSHQGSELCGIGAFCHEFCHVLGLPDFYDINYDDDNSYYEGPQEYYDIMQSGSFNANGKTPPYLSALERIMLGWMDEPQEWVKSGSYTIRPVEENVAFKTSTTNNGEYFLYEARSGKRWDSELEPGLLIYHIDKSSNKVGKYTAKYLWDNWEEMEDAGINSKKDHPCMLIVNSIEDAYYIDDVPFPGYNKVTSFTDKTKPAAKMWNGKATGFNLSEIKESNGIVTLKFSNENDKSLDDYGICYISSPASGTVSAGQSITLEIGGLTDGLTGTVWKVDGASVSGSWTATAGSHIIEAHNTYSSGKTEIIEKKVTVK